MKTNLKALNLNLKTPFATPLAFFLLFQLLDLVTTVIAIALGAHEGNPLVTHFMTVNPVAGLFFTKFLIAGVAIGGTLLGKHRGIRLASVAFCGVVVWNVTIIARLAML